MEINKEGLEMECVKRNISFKFAKGDNWNVEIIGWEKYEGWGWNVYLYLMPKHPLYKKDLEFLPFHCGITFDEIQTSIAFEVKYEFQKLTEWRKIGSDYAHLYDHFDECSALDGIPAQIENDANALVNAIENLK